MRDMRRSSSFERAVLRAVVCAAVASGAVTVSMLGADEALPRETVPAPIEFRRVHVPADRLSEIPFGTSRYVPMSAREFEEGVARLMPDRAGVRFPGVAPVMQPVADVARYDVDVSADCALSGSLTFEIDSLAADVTVWPGVRELSLGDLDVRSGTMRTQAGTGEAVIFGRQDGSLAVATPEPGVYTCAFRRPRESDQAGQGRFRLPLVPALSSTIALRVPGNLRPVVAGGGVRVVRMVDDETAGAKIEAGRTQGTWRIETGPREWLDVVLVPLGAEWQRLSTWTAVGIRGQEALIAVAFRTSEPWQSASVRLRKDPQVQVTRITLGEGADDEQVGEASWRVVDEGRGLVVDLPGSCIGGRAPLVVSAVAPMGPQGGTVPVVRAVDESWIGGGMEIRVASALSLAAVELEHGIVVPPEAAARWPLPTPARAWAASGADGLADTVGDDGVLPARVFVEEQSPRAVASLQLARRSAVVDVARVTAVDLSPVVVVGRTVCDVRVLRGEAFDLTARITPGWFVDSVETVAPATFGEAAELSRVREVDAVGDSVDWKVQRDSRGAVLRIGLTAAATPARALGLRITGHRGGMALGENVSTSSLDMVRFDGEAEQSSLVELRTGPDMNVEFEDGEQPAVALEGRLASLAEEGTVRARLWAGHRSTSRIARLVRRRPPLDVRTQVRLTVRDDRLTESFTFECQPAGSDLDAFVVQFSEPMDVPLEWSLLLPASGVVSARRLDPADARAGQSAGPVGGERWLVELVPAARGAVTIRGARTVPFTRVTAVPMAWVEGATTAIGHVTVRDVGRSRPRLVNRRLAEVAPDPDGVQGGPAVVGEFSYGPSEAQDDSPDPAAELWPSAEVRAWAWREVTSSWCHVSGATEYETVVDIENQGRASLSLSLPLGRRVQSMALDGVPVPLGDRPSAGGDLRIELPPGRQFVSLVVRTVADAAWSDRGRIGGPLPAFVAGIAGGDPAWWRVQPAAIGIDVPVLHREWRLFLPPELEIAAVGGRSRLVGDRQPPRDWAARLLGARVRTSLAEDAAESESNPPTGFRGFRLAPAADVSSDDGAIVVRRQLLAVIAVLAGVAAACATIAAARLGSWPVLLVCLVAGVAALWSAPPVDGIARAAWWSAVAAAITIRAAGASNRRTHDGRSSLVAALVTLVLVCGAAAAAEEPMATDSAIPRDPARTTTDGGSTEPLRVFMTQGAEGGGRGERGAVALVPEELFRILVRGEQRTATAPVRVLSARIVARAPSQSDAWGTWRLSLEVDADDGGILLLDQSGVGGRFPTAQALIDGVATPCRLEADGGLLWIAVPRSGRHGVEVEVEPAVQRRGETESATIAIPASPVTTFRTTGDVAGSAAAGIVCEHLTPEGAFVAAAASGDDAALGFDVSRATQVRMVRSLVTGAGFAAYPKSVISRNDVTWTLDGCRLNAVFDAEAGNAIVRSVVVVADPGLEFVDQADRAGESGGAADGISIRPLGDRRFLVERKSPERGRLRFEMGFRMRLDDAVGVFDVPAVWLEQAAVDTRAVRFVANPSLSVRVDLPAGLTVASLPDGEASFDVRSWREEVLQSARGGLSASGEAAAAALPAAHGPRARIWVERRRQDVRGSQKLGIVFAAESVRLRLEARIDASSTALVAVPLELPAGCVIDRIVLTEDDTLHPETAERGAIDVHWTRTSDTGAAVVLQRPRAGRFLLDVDARLPAGAAPTGTVPCLRAKLSTDMRTLVDWRTEDVQLVRMRLTRPGSGPASEDAEPRSSGQFELPAAASMPEYLLEAAVPDGVRRSEPDAVQRSPQDAASATAAPLREGRVELADIRLSADERGRVWGVARFDLVAAERVVRLRLPPTWRLFDVSVDGRPVEGVVPVVPQADDVWEFRLLDPGWPRSVVALFAGDLGRRLVDGEPFALPPPEIVGLPCNRVLWTVQVPEWIALRVQEPARVVVADRLEGERREAMERLTADFEQSLARTAGVDQERLRRFFEVRREGAGLDVEQTRLRASASHGAPLFQADPVTIVADAGRLTIRAVRLPDATTRGRALATLALLAGCGTAWFVTRRGWPTWLPPSGRSWPWLAVAAGMVWCVRLAPVWPGVMLVVTGGVALSLRVLEATAGVPPPDDAPHGLPPFPSGDTTTRAAPADGGD